MKQLLISISLLLLFVACSKEHDNNDGPLTKGRRTVIVYMSGRNTLSRFTNSDFQELVNGGSKIPSDDRLVVFLSRISDKEKQAIIRITGDKKQPVDTLYKYQDSFYTSEPDNFVEVIKRTMTLCPADEYALVLWGHGSGWTVEKDTRRAYGIDNGNKESNYDMYGLWLNLPDMRKCFEELGVKWKYIFCDCCNMMGAEVAYELRNHADYLVGSPAEIPGYGAPYDKMIPHLFSQADNFYEGMVDTYAADYPDYLPLSAIRLSEMESLATATRQVLPAVADHLHQGDNVATNGMIYYFSPGGCNDNANKTMYDMNDMIRMALTEQPAAYNTWHEAFTKAVPKRVVADMWSTNYNSGNGTVNFNDFDVTDEKMGAVSMFFPLNKYNNTSCLHPYNTDIKEMQWYQAVGWSTVGY
jgi:hypothetical protein